MTDEQEKRASELARLGFLAALAKATPEQRQAIEGMEPIGLEAPFLDEDLELAGFSLWVEMPVQKAALGDLLVDSTHEHILDLIDRDPLLDPESCLAQSIIGKHREPAIIYHLPKVEDVTSHEMLEGLTQYQAIMAGQAA